MSNPRLLPAIPHTPKPAISGEILYIDVRSKQNRAEFTAREYYTPRLLIRSPPTVVSLSSENSVRRSLRFFVLYYPRDKNVRPFITDLNQRQKNSSQLFQDRGGLVPRRVLNPGLPL